MSSDEAFVLVLLEALEKVQLEAIIVGSMAAIMQGAPLTTRVVDLLIRDTPRNPEKLHELGRALGGAQPIELSAVSKVVTFIGAEVPVDVLFDSLSGDLSFATLRSRCVRIPVGKLIAVVASLEDVIRSKEAAGRPKDLVQLESLRDTLRVRDARDKTRG